MEIKAVQVVWPSWSCFRGQVNIWTEMLQKCPQTTHVKSHKRDTGIIMDFRRFLSDELRNYVVLLLPFSKLLVPNVVLCHYIWISELQHLTKKNVLKIKSGRSVLLWFYTPLHYPFRFFTNAQNWQKWHYCQLCIPIYLQLHSLFVPYDVNKYEIRYQWL